MGTIREYYRDTWAEIDLDAIIENVQQTKKILVNTEKLIAVVKANAYGHGQLQIAEAALEAGADMLAVAILDEALLLRRHGIKAPILVLGAVPAVYVKLAAEQNLALTVFDRSWVLEARDILRVHGQSIDIHVKVDTGMTRLGVQSFTELTELLEEIDNKALRLQGVMTHFATADELDERQLRSQINSFEAILAKLPVKPAYIHSGNSAGILRFPEAHYNAVRLGIAMYGLSPSEQIKPLLPFNLKPALSLHTRLTQVKCVAPGTKVSYGAKYTTTDYEWIGTLPIGYADGWFRSLTGQEVLINGLRVPIVGTICMDQCMVRLPHKLEAGTHVTLIGSNGEDTVTTDELAAKLGTINYEIVCAISSRMPRVYKRAGQIVETTNILYEL